METRDILDSDGNILGTVSLPNGTSEEEWQRRMSSMEETKSLEEQIQNALDYFNEKTTSFLLSRYTIERQMSLQLIRADARLDGLMDRYNYINQVVDWVNSVLMYHFTMNYYIQSTTTPVELAQVVSELDLNQFVATDPNVWIETAMGIST